MEKKHIPSNEEKTRIIQTNKPVENPQQSPKAVFSKPSTENSGAFNSYFKSGNNKAKRTILAGAVGGGLLVSILALTSFTKKTDEDPNSSPENGSDSNKGNAVNPQEGDIIGINTGHQVYTGLHDDLSLDEARTKARESVGEDGLFIYKDELHPAMTEDEWNNKTTDEKLSYIDGINVIPVDEEDIVTLPVDVNGEIMDLKLDPLHRNDLIQTGTDDTGQLFIIPQGRPAIACENISAGENGTYYRTDPVTQEVSVFTIEELFTQLDKTGKVELEVLVPGFDEPVIEGTYMYGYIDDACSDSYINGSISYEVEPVTISGYGWGWDTDNDNDIDVYDDDFDVTEEPDPELMPEYYESESDPVAQTSEVVAETFVDETEKTDEDLLNERILQLAKDGGIDDITKIKKHRNDDGSWDIKVKGDDGEKIKTTITLEDLRQERPASQETMQGNDVVDVLYANTDIGNDSDIVNPIDVFSDNSVITADLATADPLTDDLQTDLTANDLSLNLDSDITDMLNTDPNSNSQNDFTQP